MQTAGTRCQGGRADNWDRTATHNLLASLAPHLSELVVALGEVQLEEALVGKDAPAHELLGLAGPDVVLAALVASFGDCPLVGRRRSGANERVERPVVRLEGVE